MSNKLIKWNLYEITTAGSQIHYVSLRGRLRKLGVTRGFNLLVENASDADNTVRFAVMNDSDAKAISRYVTACIADANVELVASDVPNPVLSKLRVNDATRYEI